MTIIHLNTRLEGVRTLGISPIAGGTDFRFDVSTSSDAVCINASATALHELAKYIELNVPKPKKRPAGWDALKVGDQFGFYRAENYDKVEKKRYPYVKTSATEYNTAPGEAVRFDKVRLIETTGGNMAVFKKRGVSSVERINSFDVGTKFVGKYQRSNTYYIKVSDTHVFLSSEGRLLKIADVFHDFNTDGAEKWTVTA